MQYIINFNLSRYLEEIEDAFETKHTNLDILLDDFATDHMTNWSVPKKAVPGDIVIFMCAAMARHNLGMATSHIPPHYSREFRDFVDWQKSLYKRYSGHLLGCGIVAADPEYDEESGYWYADIDHMRQFDQSVYLGDFKSFITINSHGAVTYLNDEQWERLKWVINQKNPGYFENVTAPDIQVLGREFDDSVKKEGKKPLDVLKKEAAKKSSMPVVSIVQTKTYQRDPTIAAYVKKRADGYCQLCGQKAPFCDSGGEPYLECHHIEWLSKGGMDSADNCVALCPNCHRKMHIVNDLTDIMTLKEKTGDRVR